MQDICCAVMSIKVLLEGLESCTFVYTVSRVQSKQQMALQLRLHHI